MSNMGHIFWEVWHKGIWYFVLAISLKDLLHNILWQIHCYGEVFYHINESINNVGFYYGSVCGLCNSYNMIQGTMRFIDPKNWE